MEMKKLVTWAKSVFHRVHGGTLPHWMSIWLWICGVIAMLAFSINDICPILRDYYDDETNMAVTIVVERNGSFKPPQLHLCFPYDPSRYTNRIYDDILHRYQGENSTMEKNCDECPVAQEIADQIWKEINTSDSDFKSVVTQTTNLLFDQIFSNVSGWLEKGKDDANLRKIQRSIGMMLMNSYTNIDLMFIGDNTKGIAVAFSDIYGINGELDKRKKGMELFYDYVLSYFCSMVDIRTKEAHKGNAFGSLSTGSFNNTYCQRAGHMANFRQTSAESGFCMPLPQESFQTQIDVKAWYVEDFDSNYRQFSVYTESPVPFEGEPFFVSPSFKDGQGTIVQYTIRYSMQSNVVEKRDSKQCFHETTRTDCINRCRMEKIVSTCKCVPFTTRWWSGDQSDQLPFCHGSTYVPCLGNSSKCVFEECEKVCLNACEFTSLSWQVTSTVEPNNVMEKTLKLILEPIILPYLEFTVSTKDGSKNLISEIGGSLGFYLGLSGLSVIVFVIYCIESVRRWRHGRNQHRPNQSSVLPILQWIRLTNQVSMIHPQESVVHLDSKATSQEIALINLKILELTKSVEELKKRG